jgi:hypothetical protein
MTMTPEIERRMAVLRRTLDEEPSRLMAGKVNLPASESTEGVWPPYADFLSVADGGRFGEVDLWSAQELPANEWVAEGLPGGVGRWTAIGQVVYQPLGMAQDGSVTFFPEHEPPVEFGTLDEFLLRITGGDYKSVFAGAERSPWFKVLQAAGLA